MKEATKQLLKGAILNCGLATGLINAIISNFTLPKEQSLLLSDLTMNFALTAFGCGLLCPFFGTIILKAVAGKKQIAFGEKDDHIFAKYVPKPAGYAKSALFCLGSATIKTTQRQTPI